MHSAVSIADTEKHVSAADDLVDALLNSLKDSFVSFGFQDIVHGILLESFVREIKIVIACQEEHAQIRLLRLELFGELKARHAGHLNIADEQIAGNLLRHAEHRGAAVGGADMDIDRWGECIPDQIAHFIGADGFIVDNDDVDIVGLNHKSSRVSSM